MFSVRLNNAKIVSISIKTTLLKGIQISPQTLTKKYDIDII